ncbi:MAG: 16S rRNA (guanine(527)-N(7))-methyltransferase RsmG [Oscillospiraceae bacterium]|nr:16S rRNA (guanine(527)-N(7))-methyltransferase RsmG [Oscillospiraceae bacterium]
MKEILRNGLDQLGLRCEEDFLTDLVTFSQLLIERNKVMNLTAITEPRDVATLHFLDCAALLNFADFAGKKVIDVGTGAGFPGLPLRILQRNFTITLLDSLNKRVDFLESVVNVLALPATECVHARAEEYATRHRESFDIATSRAVASLPVLSELCLPLVKVGGKFLAMKSVDTEEEINASKAAIAKLGGKIVAVKDYAVPLTDVTHRVVIIEKVSPTPAAYPRAFAKIKKQPL